MRRHLSCCFVVETAKPRLIRIKRKPSLVSRETWSLQLWSISKLLPKRICKLVKMRRSPCVNTCRISSSGNTSMPIEMWQRAKERRRIFRKLLKLILRVSHSCSKMVTLLVWELKVRTWTTAMISKQRRTWSQNQSSKSDRKRKNWGTQRQRSSSKQVSERRMLKVLRYT